MPGGAIEPGPWTKDGSLIRNNQNRRRRGGGGGPRPQQMGGGNNYGQRLDNRQRGNATQLLEKYRALARDAQQAGDRVTAEYYFQYAEHYYRILGDYRDRQGEQPRRRDGVDDDGNYAAGADGQDESDGDDEGGEPYARDSRGEERQPYARDPRNEERQPRSDDHQPRYNGDGSERSDRDQPRSDRDQPRRRDYQQAGQRDQQPRDQQPREAQPRDQQPREQQPREFRPRDEQRRERRDWNGDRNAGDGERDTPARESRPARSQPVDELPIIAGLPGPARVADTLPAAVTETESAAGDAAAAPRRRGRPRKVVAEATTEIGAES